MDREVQLIFFRPGLLTNYSNLTITTCTKDGWKEGSQPKILLESDNNGPTTKIVII